MVGSGPLWDKSHSAPHIWRQCAHESLGRSDLESVQWGWKFELSTDFGTDWKKMAQQGVQLLGTHKCTVELVYAGPQYW